MKNKLNKIIDIVKKVVSVAVTIVLSAVVLGFSISILGVGIVITIAGIVICIPIAVIFNSQTIISEIIEIHKQKKELLNKEQENYAFQKEYALKVANNIQVIKDQENKESYIEQLVPITEKDLEEIIITLPIEDNKSIEKMGEYKAISELIKREKNKDNLKVLRNRLTKLSFELQDIACSNNKFLSEYKTTEEIYQNKDILVKSLKSNDCKD